MATPRYNSGTLVEIPDGFPTQLRNFKHRHSFTVGQMAWKIAADSKGKRISEHALGNLMSCDSKRPPQERVGAVLLSNIKKMMRDVASEHTHKLAMLPVLKETETETVSPRIGVAEAAIYYEELSESDRAIVSNLMMRLVEVDPRKEAVDQLLDLAAKLESDLLNGSA